MLRSGLKSFAFVVRGQNAAFSQEKEVLARAKASRQALLAIEPSYQFLRALKIRNKDQNPVAARNLLHLFRRSTTPKDFHVAVNGVSFYQRKGADFSHLLCSHFINLCVQADKPKIVADLIVQPHHRLGAWVSRKSNLTLLKSLAKTDDLDTMVSVATVTMNKGLLVQSKESVSVLLQAANKAQSAAQFEAVMGIATKTLFTNELEAIKAEFPAFAAAEPVAAEEASA